MKKTMTKIVHRAKRWSAKWEGRVPFRELLQMPTEQNDWFNRRQMPTMCSEEIPLIPENPAAIYSNSLRD